MSEPVASISNIQSLLDAQNLTSDKIPTLQEWQTFLNSLVDHETCLPYFWKIAVDIPDALVFLFDEEMTIVATNKKASQSLGFENERDIIGKHASEFLDKEDFDASIERFNIIMGGGKLPEYQRTLVRPDGKEIHTILNLSLIEISDTKFVRSVMRDVTELHNAQAKARRYEEHLRKVLESAPVVLWACDAEGVITLSHGRGLEAIGYKSGESVGTNVFSSYSDKPHIIKHIYKALEGETQHIQVEIGNTVFDSWYQPMIEDGQVSGIVGVATDITESVHAQRRIKTIQKSVERTRDYLEAILNNSSDGIAVSTLSGKIQQTNPAFNQLLGIQPDTAYGQLLENFADPDEKEMIQSTIDYVVASKKSVRFEARTLSETNDSDFIVDILCSPIVTNDGDVYGLIFSLRDISVYRDLLKNLAESRDEALQTSRLKSEFLAIMSHEVRTPLHAIMGLTEMVQDTYLESDQREIVDLIQEQSNQLLKMLNSILDYSKLEARKMILERRAFKIQEFITSTGKQFIGQAKQKGIELRLDHQLSDNLIVYGDSQRLRQVINSFVSNAIKFTEIGYVRVSAGLIKQTETQVTVRFNIEDSGIGIPKGKLNTLFAPFVQADSSHTRRYGGTGLGLAIAQRILKLMNSEILVQSIVGEGTRFEFELTFDCPKVTTNS